MLALLLQVEAQLNPLSVQKKVKKKNTQMLSMFLLRHFLDKLFLEEGTIPEQSSKEINKVTCLEGKEQLELLIVVYR